MKRPVLLEGIIVALLVSVIASVLFTLMSAFFPTRWLLHAIIAGSGLIYIIYLLARSMEKPGRPTVIFIWFLLSIISWMFSPSILISMFIHISFIWLVRALYYYSGLFMALADLGLVLFAMLVSIWTLSHTSSLFLSLWCFFLMQSLFIFIPQDLRNSAKRNRSVTQNLSESDAFEKAYQSAQTALRQLSTQR